MNVRAATRELRQKQWESVIKDRIQSGMTVNAYCKANGITRDAYFYWLRKIKLAALEEGHLAKAGEYEKTKVEEESGFVELVPEKHATELSNEVVIARDRISIKIGEISVQVEEGTSPAFLRTVLRAVKDVE